MIQVEEYVLRNKYTKLKLNANILISNISKAFNTIFGNNSKLQLAY